MNWMTGYTSLPCVNAKIFHENMSIEHQIFEWKVNIMIMNKRY